MEKIINTKEDLLAVLAKVSFAPSCVNLDWQWDIEALHDHRLGPKDNLRGWLVNNSFVRPDALTGKVSRGKGRQEFIAIGTSESGVVKTCWLLAELIVKHELMEAFHYDGVKIFDPHHSVGELSIPARMRSAISDWNDAKRKP